VIKIPKHTAKERMKNIKKNGKSIKRQSKGKKR